MPARSEPEGPVRMQERRVACVFRSFAACALMATALSVAGEALASPPALVVLEFNYLDTSGEPRDQQSEHAARLRDMREALGSRLAEDDRFRILPVPAFPDDRCVERTDCLLGAVREAGGDLVLAGAIQKISTMASQMWVGVFDARTGERVFFRQMSFRGDTDEAWRRATRYLAREVAGAKFEGAP